MDAGLIPVKSPARAKTRLGAHFEEEQRVALARALLDDALALCRSVDFLRWHIVSDDPDVRAVARRSGVEEMADPAEGLNEVLAGAIARLQASGATSVTIVPSDVPLAWRGDIEDVLDTGATSDIVVVPARRDGGTNALYLSPPRILPPSFGDRSLAAHVAAADRMGLRCALLDLPRLALDLDTFDDLVEFLGRPRAAETATGRLLTQLGVAAT